MTESDELLVDLVRQMRREKAERQVLQHAMTSELKQKLDGALERNKELQPIVSVVAQLVDEVAELKVAMHGLLDAKTVNVQLERKVLGKLNDKLGE